MATYTIRLVSGKVRDYETKYGQMRAYRVALDGPGIEADEAVEISQKAATAAPVAGQTLEGTIETTEFGKKFKKDFNTGKTFGGVKRDEEAIKAQFAIKAAIATGLKDPLEIEALAIDLFAMVDRVKMPLITPVTKVETVFSDTEPVSGPDPFEGMDLL